MANQILKRTCLLLILSNVSLKSEEIIENIEHQPVCKHLDSNSINPKDTSCSGKYEESSGILVDINIQM